MLMLIPVYILSSLSISTNAKELILTPSESYYLFTQGKNYYILSLDSLYCSENGTDWKVNKHNLNLNHLELSYLEHDSVGYLFPTSSGTVYEFNGNEFKIAPNYYELRNQYLSYPFLYNNTIFVFGGYGLFTFKNILTYFDWKKGEWECVNTKTPLDGYPQPRRKVFGQIDGSILYIGGGNSIDYSEKYSLPNWIDLNDYWKFDLKTLEWQKLGSKQYDIKTMDNVFLYNFHGKTLVVGRDKAFSIDIKNNQITTYLSPNDAILTDIPKSDWKLNYICYNQTTGKFLCIIDKENNKYSPIIVTEDSLLGKPLPAEILYKKDNNWLIYFFGIGLFTILLSVLFVLRRKKNTIHIVSRINDCMPKLEKILTTEEMKILKKIVDSYPTSVQYPNLMEVFEQQLGYESQKKKLRTTIQELEKKISECIGSKRSVFEISQNSIDRRIKEIGFKDNA